MITYRLPPRVMEHLRLHINSATLNLVRPAGIVPQGSNDGTNIAKGHLVSFTIVQGLDRRQELRLCLGQIS
jgi:hypothetical protein